MIDKPGTEADQAVFDARVGGPASAYVLGRSGGEVGSGLSGFGVTTRTPVLDGVQRAVAVVRVVRDEQ